MFGRRPRFSGKEVSVFMPSTIDEERSPEQTADSSGRGERATDWPTPAPALPKAPENRFADPCIAAGLLVLSFLYLWLFRRYTTIDPDEGIILQGADRILHGQVLYRDFFSFITPGAYYLLALVFKIFGNSMLVARTLLALYGGAFTAFTYLLARRVCSRATALFTAYLVLITCLPWRFMVLHNWDSTLWACAALYSAVWLVQKPHWGWALALGSFASLTVLFEQSKGAGLMLGLGLGFAILMGFARPRLHFTRAQWIALVAGLAWPFIVTLTYFGSQHALPALMADWSWPLHHYTKSNDVPYGYQDWSGATRQRMFYSGSRGQRLITLLAVTPCFVIPVLPILAMILLVYWLLEWKRGRLPQDRAAYYILSCCTLAGLLPSILIVRANIIHFVYLIPLFYLPLAWIVEGTDLRGSLTRSLKPAIIMGLLVLFSAVGMALFLRAKDANSALRTRRGELRAAKPDAVIEYTQAHVPPGSKVLIYPYRPLYYYVTDTISPTPYEYIQAGMHTGEQEEEVIRDLAADGTRVVLFEPGFAQTIPNSWPNTPIQFIANDPVADYILQHYRSCRVMNSAGETRLLFMVRKDLTCPQ